MRLRQQRKLRLRCAHKEVQAFGLLPLGTLNRDKPKRAACENPRQFRRIWEMVWVLARPLLGKNAEKRSSTSD